MELKSNQSTPPMAVMETTRAASKPVVMVEKKMSKGFKSH